MELRVFIGTDQKQDSELMRNFVSVWKVSVVIDLYEEGRGRLFIHSFVFKIIIHN